MRTLVTLLVVLGVAVAVACEPSIPRPPLAAPTSTLPRTGGSDSPPVIVTELVDSGASADGGGGATATCGCKLCAPVVSDDACTTDDDCAPSDPCHAHACVAKSKAKPYVKGEACSEIRLCNTADANACGCVAGKCTLHAR